jgi:uncharacterized protein (TIGR02246 family)
MFHWEGMADLHASDLIDSYLAAFARGDAEALDDLYEPGALVVPRPGSPLTGAARIAAHRHLLGFGAPMTAAVRHAYTAGDLALLVVDWAVRGSGPRGPVELSGTAADVARRGADDRWRYVIDNPGGTAWAEPAVRT